MSQGKEQEVDAIRRKFAEDTQSDHLMIVKVFDAWRNSGKNNAFCWRNFLSHNALNQIEWVLLLTN